MSIIAPLKEQPRAGHEFATLGGGCFWCLEPVFVELDGVIDVECGFAGGHVVNPTYRVVSAGDTGHAEVVRIEYDPKKLSYRQILEVFFAIHDPTSVDRQGVDQGPQYRSIIGTHSEAQQAQAQALIAEIAPEYEQPIVTQVEPVKNYARAENYHQEFYRLNPAMGYCMLVIAPKLEKFRGIFAHKRKKLL